MTAAISCDEDVIQAALERLTDEMVGIGISVTVETDFEEFAFLRKRAGEGGCYPAVDPAHSRLDKDAFWVRVEDREGNLVGLYAERIYRCEDFMELLRSERLWFDRSLRLVSNGYRPLEESFESFGGVVGHGCGLWIHPSARRHGLSAWLPDFQRALAVRNYDLGWQTCLVFEALAEHTRKAYGYTDVRLVVDGYFPVTRSDARVYLGRMTRQEVVARLAAPRVTREVRPARAAAAY